MGTDWQKGIGFQHSFFDLMSKDSKDTSDFFCNGSVLSVCTAIASFRGAAYHG